MHLRSTTSPKTSGFSLLEVLVVISIIGIVTALAIPTISNLSDTAKDTVARRNATSLATISASLAGVGMAHVIPESLGGVEATCRLLKRGIVVTEGPMNNSFFALPGLEDEQIPLAAEYLDILFQSYSVLQLIYVLDGKEAAK